LGLFERLSVKAHRNDMYIHQMLKPLYKTTVYISPPRRQASEV